MLVKFFRKQDTYKIKDRSTHRQAAQGTGAGFAHVRRIVGADGGSALAHHAGMQETRSKDYDDAGGRTLHVLKSEAQKPGAAPTLAGFV